MKNIIHPLQPITNREKAFINGTYFGPKHHSWKGDNITLGRGNQRAREIFESMPCENCGNPKSQRHHKDGNPRNNNPKNIKFLCAKCHMERDGRLNHLHNCNAGRLPIYKPKYRPKNSKSPYMGVQWDSQSGKWKARINVEGRRFSLGTFKTDKEASEAYERAIRKYFAPRPPVRRWKKKDNYPLGSQEAANK